MPAYDYDCAACGRRFEVVHGLDAERPTTCPLCGKGPIRKAISAPAIHYRGSGWAKKERRATATTGASKATGDASTSGDGSTSGEAGPKGEGGSTSGEGNPKGEGGSTDGSKGPSPAAKPKPAEAGAANAND